MLYLLKRTDGGVTVLQMIEQPDGRHSTPEKEMSKWAPHTRDAVVSWREIKPEHLPKDRSFRNAWCDVTPEPTVDIDMPKARDIHRNRLREMRAPKLAALDIESMKAVIAKDDKKTNEIEAKKQALRDVTKHPSIDAATTPEQLMAAVPDALS